MNKKCKCGGYISTYINMGNLAKCCDCHRCYALFDNKWENISRMNFSILFKKELIEQQKSN